MQELTKEEIELIKEALNQYWHQAHNEVQKKNIGALELKNWLTIRLKCKQLMSKL